MPTTITTEYDPTLFQGAADYYVRHRSRYPQELFNIIAARFHLDGKGRLLDLGAGPGLVAIPFSDRFAEVVAIDPDPEMLAAGKKDAAIAKIPNIRWIEDRAESIGSELGKFDLVTFGRSFHWMERSLVLEKLSALLTPTGGVAILKTGDDPWNSELPWKQAAISVVKRWLGAERRTGKAGAGTWQALKVAHEEILTRVGFTEQVEYTVTFDKNWTIDTYIGYLYSTAFALPSFFGDNRDRFESDLHATLLEISPSGNLTEELTASALIATKSS